MVDQLHAFTLAHVPRGHRRSYPHGIATVDGTDRWTWPELDDRVNQLANALTHRGIGTGDVVLWAGQNSHRVIECLLACAKTGAVCCVANWRSSADELAFVIADCEPSVVVWQESEVGDTARAARDNERPIRPAHPTPPPKHRPRTLRATPQQANESERNE